MSKRKRSNLSKFFLSTLACSVLGVSLVVSQKKDSVTADSVEKHSYSEILTTFKDSGAEGDVKQYIKFLQDPTYKPSIANKSTYMPSFMNATTFVNADFNVKPSIFPSLRSVNTSVLDKTRNFLWIGTNQGVTKINLKSNKSINYSMADGTLFDDKVLFLIDDGHQGVFAITESGVSHITE